MLRPFQDHLQACLVPALKEIAPWMRVARKGSNRVLASGALEGRQFPHRFIEILAIQGREEFLIDLAWADTASVPSRSYYQVVGSLSGPFRLPAEGCTLPLTSGQISGKDSVAAGPWFEAAAPSMERKRSAILSALSDPTCRKKLMDWLETVLDGRMPTQADIDRCLKQPGFIFGTGMAGALSTNWQLIHYLGVLTEQDAEAALGRSIKSAISQLRRRGVPFLRSLG